MRNLHVHDKKGSLLDSILSIDDIVKFAVKNNQDSIALTNHGTMHSYVDFHKSCIENNIKPIHGCEIYEVDDMNLKNDTKENKQPRYHLVLLAKNQKGFNNLIKISSEGYSTGFYGKPRVDLDYIEKNSLGDGIICLTACMAGRLSRMVEGRKTKYTPEGYIERLKKIFDYVSLEIQSHPKEDQAILNNGIIEIANRTNTSYVITSDAHMLEDTDFEIEAHSIFIQIGTERNVGDTYKGCYLQTDDDVYKNMNSFHSSEVLKKAIEETHKIATMVEIVDIGLNSGNKMPEIKCPPQFENNYEYIQKIIEDLFEEKYGHLSEENKQKRRDRINMELPILKELDYIDYFLMLRTLVLKGEERNIPLGYSRGSGGNCQVLYSLGVTQIDSVRWDLDFSRFANLGRRSMAD